MLAVCTRNTDFQIRSLVCKACVILFKFCCELLMGHLPAESNVLVTVKIKIYDFLSWQTTENMVDLASFSLFCHNCCSVTFIALKNMYILNWLEENNMAHCLKDSLTCFEHGRSWVWALVIPYEGQVKTVPVLSLA